jgi:WD40 repeat protein
VFCLAARPKLKAARRSKTPSKAVIAECSVQSVAFADEQTLITVSDRDRNIRVWDLRRAFPHPIHSMPYAGSRSAEHSFVALALDPSRTVLYANATDNTVYAYDLINFNPKPREYRFLFVRFLPRRTVFGTGVYLTKPKFSFWK